MRVEEEEVRLALVVGCGVAVFVLLYKSCILDIVCSSLDRSASAVTTMPMFSPNLLAQPNVRARHASGLSAISQ